MSIVSNYTIPPQNFTPFTPLTYAVHNNNFHEVKRLLEEGADVNEIAKIGWGPIHIALSLTDQKIAHYIMKQPKFNPNLQTPFNHDTPLMWALVHNRKFSAIKLVLHKGINLKLKNKEGKTYKDYLSSLSPSAKL